MTRKPKTTRVPCTRAGGKWTESRFWTYLRSRLRLAWRNWPARGEAVKAGRVPYHGPNKRQKFESICAICNGRFKGTDTQVDHIIPCGRLKSFEDLSGFAERLFCEPNGLRVLCKECHAEVTAKERRNAKQAR